MLPKYWCAGGLLLLISVALAFITFSRTKEYRVKIASFWSANAPYSTDPLDYDAAVHHLMFRSVLSPIITQYRLGQYSGLLTDHWEASDDFKVWRFRIRDGLSFENGDPITAEVVIRSWLRMAYIQKRHNSKSGFLELLKGYEKLSSVRGPIEGLTANQNTVVLSFKSPVPKLLDTIGFGLYSVVHPADYDERTGEWKNPQHVIASGAYKIKSWTDKALILQLRSDYPVELRNEHAITEVRFTWDLADRDKADIVAGNSDDLALSRDRVFYGAAPSSIGYIFCYSWSDPNSIFHDLDVRKRLRTEFYKAVIASGLKPVLSFFPLAIPGVHEQVLQNEDDSGPIAGELRYYPTNQRNLLFSEFNRAIRAAAASVGLKTSEVHLPLQQVYKQKVAGLGSYLLDFSTRTTGILIDAPDDDVRFMFLSKEGIRLPDTDGRIGLELAREELNIEKINNLLWDQAVVWPMGHFAYGLWAKSSIDASLLNTVMPPTELQWIGWK